MQASTATDNALKTVNSQLRQHKRTQHLPSPQTHSIKYRP